MCDSPSHEWQDRVATTLRNRGSEPNFSTILSGHTPPASYHGHQSNGHTSTLDHESSSRRQRRKTSGEGLSNDFSTYDTSYVRDDRHGSASTTGTPSDDDIMDAVGQLSLNEDEEIRYHGKASGLHLLGGKERIDSRNEGGIWSAFSLLSSTLYISLSYNFSGCRRFPPARVWPPLPTDKRYNALITGTEGDEHLSKLPDPKTQDHLLDLYFTYVHPSLPVVHKKAFLDIFRQV